jgi:hypothetical protein
VFSFGGVPGSQLTAAGPDGIRVCRGDGRDGGRSQDNGVLSRKNTLSIGTPRDQ